MPEDRNAFVADLLNPAEPGEDRQAFVDSIAGEPTARDKFPVVTTRALKSTLESSPVTGDEAFGKHANAQADAYRKQLGDLGIPDEQASALRDEFQKEALGKLQGQHLQRHVENETAYLKSGIIGRRASLGDVIGKIPGARIGWGLGTAVNLTDAANNIKAGKATDDDYKQIASHLARTQYDAELNQRLGRGEAGAIAQTGWDVLSQLPAEIAEWMAMSGPAKAAGELAAQGVKGVGLGTTSQTVAKGLAMVGTRTLTAPGKLGEEVAQRQVPAVGIEQGKVKVGESEPLSASTRKALINQTLNNAVFEATGTFEPKGGFTLANIAGSTVKAVGAGQFAAAGSHYLGGGGPGDVGAQLAEAKTPEERKRILAHFAIESGAFALLETGMHGLPHPDEVEPAIEQTRSKLKDAGIPNQQADKLIADALQQAATKQQQPIPPKPGETPATKTGKPLPTPDELTAALAGKDQAQEIPTVKVQPHVPPPEEVAAALAEPRLPSQEVQGGVDLETMRAALKVLRLNAKDWPEEKVRSEAARLGIDKAEVKPTEPVAPQKAATYEPVPEPPKPPEDRTAMSYGELIREAERQGLKQVWGLARGKIEKRLAAKKEQPERRGPNRPPQGVWEGIKAEHPDWTVEQIGREAARQADELKVDKLTGFLNGQVGTARQDATGQAIAHVERNDGPATYAEIDLANLGGLNAHAGHEGANRHYRAFADIIKAELDPLNPTLFRHGGDEMSAVVHAPQAEVDAAMQRAQVKALEYAKANGLDTIPHPKNSPKTPRPSGTGIHYGTADVRAGDKPADVYSRADRALEERKVQAHVNGTPSEALGVVPPPAQPQPAATRPPELEAPTRPPEPPAAVHPLDALAERFQSGEHVDFAEVADAAGLNPRERALLDATMEGLTFEQAAKRMGLNSRQRAHQVAGDIAEKLGMDRSLSKTVLDSLRAGAAERGQSREVGGEEVQAEAFHQPVEKMTAEEQTVVRRARRSMDEAERIQKQIEKLADQFIKESDDAGADELPAERLAFFQAENDRLGRTLAVAQARGRAARRGGEGVAGEPGARIATPVRPEGEQLREGPAAPEVPPAGPGGEPGRSPEAPAGSAEAAAATEGGGGTAAPAPTERGQAGGDELAFYGELPKYYDAPPPATFARARAAHASGDEKAWADMKDALRRNFPGEPTDKWIAQLGNQTRTKLRTPTTRQGVNRQIEASYRQFNEDQLMHEERVLHEATQVGQDHSPAETSAALRSGLQAGEAAKGDAEPGTESSPAESAAGATPGESFDFGFNEPGGATGGDFGRPLTAEERAKGALGGGQEGAAQTPIPKGQTALANVVTEQERAKDQLPEMVRQAARSNQSMWNAALLRLQADPQAASRLVDDLAHSNRPPTTEENALLLQRRVAMRNELDRAIKEANQAFIDERKAKAKGLRADELAAKSKEAEARYDALSLERDRLDKVIQDVGSETGRSLQFRRQLAKEDFSLEGLIGREEVARRRPLTAEERSQLVALQEQIAALQKRLEGAEDALAKSGKGVAAPEFPEWQAARAATMRKQGEALKRVTRARWENMTWPERIGDWLVKARVASVISSPVTAAKVGLASLERIAIAPAEELVGRALRMVPGLSEIAARAPVEGRGFDPATEGLVLKKAVTEGAKDAWQTIRTGSSELDVLYGDNSTPYTWLDVIGASHAAEKAPAVRAAYERAFANIVAHEAAAGRDATSPGALERIGLQAYAEGQRAKFQQDNAVVDAYNRAVNSLRSEKQPAGVRALGLAVKLLTPVVRVPTNIVAEAFQYAFGSVTGSVRAAGALRGGVENLKPAQADLIMRSLKKGTLGLATLALGYWLGPQFLGGFYTGRRREDEVETGGLKTPAGEVPSFAMHHPLFMVLQLGAAVRRAEADHPQEGFMSATARGMGGLIEEVPLVREQTEVARVFEGGFNQRAVGNLAKSFAIPQLLQWFAKRFDTDTGNPLTGTPTPRKVEGIGEAVASGVPFGRNYLEEGTPRVVGDFYDVYHKADAEHRDFIHKRQAGLAAPTYTQAKYGEYQRLQWTEQRMVKLNEALLAAKTDEQKAEIRRQQALLARQALRRGQ